MMLLGAFPLVYFMTKVLAKPLRAVGRLLGMGETGTAGMIATLANNIPMFGMMKDMGPRAKVLNCAFAVSAAFTFGDHLGFTAGVNRDMITPMIAGKLVAGVTAIAAALLFFGKVYGADAEEQQPSEDVTGGAAPADLETAPPVPQA